MDELQQILEQSKINKNIIEDNLINPVLGSADYLPREVFSEITEISDAFFQRKSILRMIGLAGLRGTGKTTLLWQSAKYIYENYTENIYFFHLGQLREYDISVFKIKNAFEKYIVKDRLSSYRKDIVLLFDEVHEDPNWASSLKVLYDLFPAVFVVATGSSALLLQSTADLVTRMLIQHVFPLSFTEFQSITNPISKQEFSKLPDILFNSDNVIELYNSLNNFSKQTEIYYSQIENTEEQIIDYVLYKNITRNIFLQNNALINSSITDLIRRVIYEDIPKMYEAANIKYSEKILRRLAASDEINTQTLSQAIGISQNEIIENLDILEKAELLNALYPFGGVDTQINKSQKYFFMSPSIRRVLLRPVAIDKIEEDTYAKMLEDTVVMYLKRLFRMDSVLSFSSQKGKKNPDLIIETLPNPIIIEVGIGKRTSKQISKSRIKYKYGIIINSKLEEITINEQDRTIILPLKYFLLL